MPRTDTRWMDPLLRLLPLLLALSTQAVSVDGDGDGDARTVISPPSDFDWTPLLTVIRTGPGAYTVDKSAAELRTSLCAGRTVTPCFVDPLGGSDANSGKTQALALKTMQAAAGKASADITEIIVIPPPSRIVWGSDATINGFAGSASIRPIDGKPIVFCKGAKPVWTALGDGTFTTTGPTGAANSSIVMDWSAGACAAAPDGGGLGYVRAEVAAAVAGRPGTFFHDTSSGLVTVCPFGNRSLVGDEFVTPPTTSDLNCWSMQTPSAATTGRLYLAAYCHWVGGLNPLGMNNNSQAKARTMFLFDHCGMWAGSLKGNAMSAVGPNDIYAFDCIGGYSGADLWNLHGNGLGSGRIFHVRPRCTVRNGFGGAGRDNVDTGHEDSRGITLMPVYANSDGRVFGWIDRSRALVFGGRIGPSFRTTDYSASVNAGGITVVDLFEVALVPSKGPFTLTADGKKNGSGASIRCHGMDITATTQQGNIVAATP